MRRPEALLRAAKRANQKLARLEEQIRQLRAAKRAEKRRLRRLTTVV